MKSADIAAKAQEPDPEGPFATPAPTGTAAVPIEPEDPFAEHGPKKRFVPDDDAPFP